MWSLSSNSMNMSSSDSNNSEANCPISEELEACENLDVSMYENKVPEDESVNNEGTSMQRQESTSRESGYGTPEFLSSEERSFIFNSSDTINNLKDEQYEGEILNFYEDEKPIKLLKLPLDFDSLISATLNPQSLVSSSGPTKNNSNSTPTSSSLKQSNKRTRARRTFPTTKIQNNVERYLKIVKLIPKPTQTPLNPEDIKLALQRSSTDTNLIGDFTKPNYLPLVDGRHQDLKAIAASTMYRLLNGDYTQDVIFKIIDCRYPYEYDGGHITGAVNIFSQELLLNNLLSENALADTKLDLRKRYILIFHCEFSSVRAPSLYRFFRNFDRNQNNHVYPALHYPEMYLLEGGYKNFYMQYSTLCSPNTYLPMNHPKYINELSYYREKSKSSNVGTYTQATLKRFNFL